MSSDSRTSARHGAFRNSLRPSQELEPRHPPLQLTVTSPASGLQRSSERSATTRAHVFQISGAQGEARHKALAYRLCANDPSAGSPTETLLRLLLPLSDKVHETSCAGTRHPTHLAVRIIHRITQSVGATGGVYKGQGRNQHELMTRAY
jgi:hypothetical protein